MRILAEYFGPTDLDPIVSEHETQPQFTGFQGFHRAWSPVVPNNACENAPVGFQ